MNDDKLKEIKDRWEKAATIEEWKSTKSYCNYPFYTVLYKPRQSLSKHEGTHKGRDLWNIHDAIFVLRAKEDMKVLFNIIKDLKKK